MLYIYILYHSYSIKIYIKELFRGKWNHVDTYENKSSSVYGSSFANFLLPIFLLVPHQNIALSRLSPTLSNLVCIPACNLYCAEGKYLF
jgi:hypothetical protein